MDPQTPKNRSFIHNFLFKMLRVEERGKLFQFKVNMCYVSNMYAEITGQIITKPQSP